METKLADTKNMLSSNTYSFRRKRQDVMPIKDKISLGPITKYQLYGENK
jgi:hypothetical protein